MIFRYAKVAVGLLLTIGTMLAFIAYLQPAWIPAMIGIAVIGIATLGANLAFRRVMPA